MMVEVPARRTGKSLRIAALMSLLASSCTPVVECGTNGKVRHWMKNRHVRSGGYPKQRTRKR